MITETLLLGMTEEQFWESTPRKIIALIDQKKEIERANQKNLAIYIACCVWGKDPNEIEEREVKTGLIPGIDIPIEAGLVERLL